MQMNEIYQMLSFIQQLLIL